jgi:diguanylate cyclase (GGDEF)-like protein
LSASLRRHAEPRSSDRAHQGYAPVIEPKAINDAFGHAAGDNALRAFVEVLRSHTRAQDTVCRTGGEEFTVVFPDTTHDEAGRIANPVMAAVRAAHIGPSANLSVSAGVATSPRSLDEPDHLVQRADSHLMQANGDGRDRVICDAV